jgi:hypothetical protein
MPGDSTKTTGILKDSGAYTQNSGTLDILIDGTTAGSKYDQFNPTTASLSGTLNINVAAGFVPKVGSTFKIMNFTSETGTFATVNGLAINSSEHFTITYQGTDVLLTVVSGAAASNTASVASIRASSLAGRTSAALNPVGRGFGPGRQVGAFNFLPSNPRPLAIAASAASLSSAPQVDAQPRSGASIRTTRSRGFLDSLASPKFTAASPIEFGTPAKASSQSISSFTKRQLGVRDSFHVGMISAAKLASQDSAGYQHSVNRISAFVPARNLTAGTAPHSLTGAGESGAIRGRNNPTAAALLHNAGHTSRLAVPLAYHVDPLSILEKGPKKALRDLWKQPGSADSTNYLTIGGIR